MDIRNRIEFSDILRIRKNGLIYLATPYSHNEMEIREWRYREINKFAAYLIRLGVHVYSPISHLHEITKVGEFPMDFDFWEENCHLFCSLCVGMIIYTQPGWEKSIGVHAEVDFMNERNKPIALMEPVT
jgi:hypothetical protein